MADDELKLYPIGQVGFGAGNLKECTLGRWSLANGATLRHSLAKSPSGVTLGNFEITGALEFEVSEDGIERGVVEDVAKGRKRNFRFKDAGDTYSIIGVLSNVEWVSQRPNPVKVNCQFIGKLVL